MDAAGRGRGPDRADALPDLPGLPKDLSVEQLAETSRYLDARDARKGLKGAEVEMIPPVGGVPEPGPDDPFDASPARPFAFVLGAFDRRAEAEPLDEEGRMVAKSGEVLTATGHRLYAVLILEGESAYEHWDTTLFAPVYEARGTVGDLEIFCQSQEDFEEVLRRLRRQRSSPYSDLEPFPYTYRYFDASARKGDPHVDPATGWSKNGREVMHEVARRALAKNEEKDDEPEA